MAPSLILLRKPGSCLKADVIYEPIDPSGVGLQILAPLRGQLSGTQRDWPGGGSVGHFDQMKDQRQARHEGAEFRQVLDHDGFLAVLPKLPLMRSQPVVKKPLRVGRKMKVRGFFPFLQGCPVCAEFHFGQPLEHSERPVLRFMIGILIDQLPILGLIGIHENLEALDQAVILDVFDSLSTGS